MTSHPTETAAAKQETASAQGQRKSLQTSAAASSAQVRRRYMMGKLGISALALLPAIGNFPVEYNRTHMFNPFWRPHAKYHLAQTMVLGIVSGAAALALLWVPGRKINLRNRFDAAAFLSVLWPVTAVPSILFPGTAYEDPEMPGHLPKIGPVTVNQTRSGLFLIGLGALIWRVCRPPRSFRG